MAKPKLTYFDAPVSRGEECRLALHLAGVDFDDQRINRADWTALKPTTPYGSLPLLEIPGRPVLAQSNAILVYVGREHGLHPRDNFEAARHESMMHHVEDLRVTISPTMRMSDEEEKRKARVKLAETSIPAWATHAEGQVRSDGPFFGGAAIHVVDLKLYVVVHWLRGGVLDHIPATVLDPYPKLNRIHDAVRDHAGVRAWYAKH
jgi:glutathione S-transferase